MSAAVSVHELSKRYGALEAVRGVSFEVAAGGIFGLLGPNGAGKTTTLECILGLRRPDTGAVSIGGVDALAHPGAVKELVGAQLQAATLQDRITPRQALRLFGAFYRDHAGPDALLGRFRLADRADAAFATLSGGEKQRLFVALAFVNNPRLVVLDEPTAGLDPQSRRELHGAIAGMRAAGRAVLLSTHDLEEARQLCDRLAIIEAGRIVATATPDELIARSRAVPRLSVRTAKPLDAARLAALGGVTGCEATEGGWTLATTDVNRTIVELARLLESDANELRDLQIRRPSLEDVFLELTGRNWSAGEGKDGAR